MLTASDILELPPGVTVRGGRLADDVRGVSVPVNPAALLVVSAAGHPLSAIADQLGAAFAIPRPLALNDVLAFVWQLNRLGLANVRRRSGPVAAAAAWLVIAARLLPAGTLPPTLARRVPLDTRSARAAAAGVARGLAPRALAVGLVTAVAVVPAASVVGPQSLVLAASVGLGVAVALVVHEAGHAAALAGAAPAALILGWRRISVVHAPLTVTRAQAVAAAGPLASGLGGLTLTVAAAAAVAPELAVGGLPLAGHALGLLAFTSDGRKACGT